MLNEQLTVCCWVHINQAQCFVFVVVFFTYFVSVYFRIRTNTIVCAALNRSTAIGRRQLCRTHTPVTHTHIDTSRNTQEKPKSPFNFWPEWKKSMWLCVSVIAWPLTLAVVWHNKVTTTTITTYTDIEHRHTFGCAHRLACVTSVLNVMNVWHSLCVFFFRLHLMHEKILLSIRQSTVYSDSILLGQ